MEEEEGRRVATVRMKSRSGGDHCRCRHICRVFSVRD